jgi:uncharacterized protein (TIGR02118 family)
METRYKLLIMFLTPEDTEAFERRWAEEFVPLAERLPGLRRVVVARTHGGPAGPVAVHLVHELHFDDFEALRAAMRSEAGVAAGQCLVKMAGKRVTLAFAEHMEDVPSPLP